MEALEKYIGVGIKEIFPDFMKYLNLYRNIRGRFDLMMFLYTWILLDYYENKQFIIVKFQ